MDTADDNEDAYELSVPQQQLVKLYNERYGIHISKYLSSGYKFRVANLNKINSSYKNH